MPLESQLPVIDDRRYADLVAEARTRIPRYTPEWTDLNESDPGMAMVELFAWMGDQLLYRLGRVPELNYLKFLELIGIELVPATPARTQIVFPVQPGFAEPTVIVPKGTQVSSSEPDAQGPILFELDRALVALTATLDAVQVFEAPAFRDVSVQNAQLSAFAPFGPRAVADSALALGFSSTLDFPAGELDLAFWVKAPASGAPLFCNGPSSARPVSTVVWEYFDGTDFRPLQLLADETLAFTRDGHVRLQLPAAGSLQAAKLGKKSDKARYWVQARLARSGYQVAPQLLGVRCNVADATAAQTVQLEVLGGSDGRPDQQFNTKGTPVLAGTLVVEIDEGDGFVAWSEREDLFGAGPDDTVYVLDRATGTVRFGDGQSGRIPVANGTRPANVRARVYRYGGGARGNVAAGKLTQLMSGIAGLAADKVTNPFAAGGGADEEELAKAKERAAASLKSRDRAVTPGDFEALALESGGIARALALPLRHPQFPGVEVPGVVSVVVVPDVDDPAPLPTPGTLRSVCAYLNDRRLLTTELYVVPPRYRTLTVTATLVVADDADLAAVDQAALAALDTFLGPLHGGVSGTGWPFGGGIYTSSVVRQLLVDGVLRVTDLTFQLDEQKYPACTDLTLEPDTLLRSGAHQLSVQYDDGGTP